MDTITDWMFTFSSTFNCPLLTLLFIDPSLHCVGNFLCDITKGFIDIGPLIIHVLQIYKQITDKFEKKMTYLNQQNPNPSFCIVIRDVAESMRVFIARE